MVRGGQGRFLEKRLLGGLSVGVRGVSVAVALRGGVVRGTTPCGKRTGKRRGYIMKKKTIPFQEGPYLLVEKGMGALKSC